MDTRGTSTHTQVDPLHLFELATKLAALVDVLREDVQRLEDEARRRLERCTDERDVLRTYAKECADEVERRVEASLQRRVVDLGLDRYADLKERVATHEEFIQTAKAVALQYGVYGGLLTGGMVLVVYVVRGAITGDWGL